MGRVRDGLLIWLPPGLGPVSRGGGRKYCRFVTAISRSQKRREQLALIVARTQPKLCSPTRKAYHLLALLKGARAGELAQFNEATCDRVSGR
jgi:hypothetical protein